MLRISVLIQCVGLWRLALVDGTAIGTTLFMTFEWSEAAMLLVDRGAAWLLLIAGGAAMLRFGGAVERSTIRVACAFVAAWFALVALASWYQGGFVGYQYSVVAHANRIVAPIALISLAASETRRETVILVLRAAAASTFAAHGLEALQHHPEFIDYIITAFRRIGVRVPESMARVFLTAIGVQDMLLAALMMTRRWRLVVAYAAAWGAITAASRVVHLGWLKWPQVLVRAANGGVPLALFFLWASSPPHDDHHHDAEDEEPHAGP